MSEFNLCFECGSQRRDVIGVEGEYLCPDHYEAFRKRGGERQCYICKIWEAKENLVKLNGYTESYKCVPCAEAKLRLCNQCDRILCVDELWEADRGLQCDDCYSKFKQFWRRHFPWIFGEK